MESILPVIGHHQAPHPKNVDVYQVSIKIMPRNQVFRLVDNAGRAVGIVAWGDNNVEHPVIGDKQEVLLFYALKCTRMPKVIGPSSIQGLSRQDALRYGLLVTLDQDEIFTKGKGVLGTCANKGSDVMFFVATPPSAISKSSRRPQGRWIRNRHTRSRQWLRRHRTRQGPAVPCWDSICHCTVRVRLCWGIRERRTMIRIRTVGYGFLRAISSEWVHRKKCPLS